MSTSNQSNGKKINSANNSSANTPSSTPVSTVANSANQAPIQSTTPPNNAPKYGTLVPNRIFVGGISANTTEAELLQLFSNYGTVKAAKIIQDRAGVSKGYGFITFESEEEAKRLQREADNIVLRERKLNIAPAIKKQPFNRAFDASSPPAIAPGGPTQYFIPAGSVPFYQGGVTYYTQPPPPPPADPSGQHQQPPVFQPPAVFPTQTGPPQTAAYPLVYPTQPIYMTQQFPYQPVPYEYNYYPNGGPPQYMVGNQGAPQPQPPPMQPPGSPPRTPCFNPQLPYGSDAMYYNMPLYGPMEGTAIYQDPLDMTNGNLEVCREPLKEPFGADEDADVDAARQSNTPVVSLLSLDHHQEKDLTALQSGRRRKSADPAPPSAPPPFANAYPARTNSFPSILNNSHDFHHFGPPDYHKYPAFNSGFKPPDRGWPQSTNKRRVKGECNSSTVDENRNEEKRETPPPPLKFGTRTFNPRVPRGVFLSSKPKTLLKKPDVGDKLLACVTDDEEPGCAPDFYNPFSPPPFPQIPAGAAQNFIPPSRRTRRSARRNAHASAPLSEIGAGDAPIPNSEVGDACKKLDNLKL